MATTFPQLPLQNTATLYLEETDKRLPKRVDAHTRYAFFKTIARGGKSIIQSCKDLQLCRVICYKSLKRELNDDPIEEQRFLREARVTAMLQHPGTVPVYELGRDNRGHLYFTMKFVHGYTLREMLDPAYRSRYALLQLIEVIIQVARALDYAHTHGVAHRDIKPENILVGPFGEVLVLDWGLAKVWDKKGTSDEPPPENLALIEPDDLSLTRQGKLQGTVSYMSPEQIRRDGDLDVRTDLFSLGVVLYEVLCGKLPAPGDVVDDIVGQILHAAPKKPSEVSRTAVPKRLEEICLKLLEKDRGRRIQTAAELVRELQEDWRD